ncbi:MAG: hypothetical protein WCO63_01360 [Bacteroidota bacterium]
MRQAILLIVTFLFSLGVFGQALPVGNYQVLNASTTFGISIHKGAFMYDMGTDRTYRCITAATSAENLTTASAKFTLVGNGLYLTSEVDGSVSNEGSLSVVNVGGNSNFPSIHSNTTGSTDIALSVGGSGLSLFGNPATGGIMISSTPMTTLWKEGTLIGTQYRLDVQDSSGINVVVTNDPSNLRVKLGIINTAPDQTVTISNGTGISHSGTYPNFTITNAAPDQTVSITNGTGISHSGTYPNFTITNTAPNQTVTISSGTGLTVTGTYPNFTLTNSAPWAAGLGDYIQNQTASPQTAGFSISGRGLITWSTNTVAFSVTKTTGVLPAAQFTNSAASNGTGLEGIGTGVNSIGVKGTATSASGGVGGFFSSFNSGGDTACSVQISTGGARNFINCYFSTTGGYIVDVAGNVTQTGFLSIGKVLTFANRYANTSSGNACTINWNRGNSQTYTNSENSTFTFTAPPGNAGLKLKIIHAANTNTYNITWPSTVKWPSGTAPTLTQASGAKDWVNFEYDATDGTYSAMWVGDVK